MGLIVTTPGILLRALASGHVRKNEALTTSGPYAYTRNPLYLGSLVIAIGFLIAARSWWIVAVAVVYFLAVYIPVIRGEENYLRSKFPEFENYTRTVPRLLPRLSLDSSEKGSFSWELYKKHREYNAILGALAVSVILLAKMFWLKNY
ncbi:MAG TPA: isoprenylcysteine carboxylmethyltransferase family protein [Terriglobales bacterium]|nr:isoprenylcysteine carboxylmethyltransferase family protein [Terriglobales bacterium]